MKLTLSDIESNAVKHALEAYGKYLEDAYESKAAEYELDAVKCVMDKMENVSHAPGV